MAEENFRRWLIKRVSLKGLIVLVMNLSIDWNNGETKVAETLAT